MTAGRFKDHFSGHAGDYAAHRPRYPDSLFEFLSSLAPSREIAWDCGTGNGQAARSLAPYFKKVIATDASAEQVASAPAADGVEYRVAPAESSELETESIDLITVAQALHWFEIDAFFDEAKRVLKAGGILAVWCYERCRIDDSVNDVIERVFAEVEPYWPPERDIVESGYRSIRLPFDPIEAPPFFMRVSWTAEAMLGYMQTWSASRRYHDACGSEATAPHAQKLRQAWGEGERTVAWPLRLKIARK